MSHDERTAAADRQANGSAVKAGLYSAFKAVYNIAAASPLRYIPGSWKWRISNSLFRSVWPSGNVIDVQGSKMYIDVNERNPALRKTFQMYAMSLVHEESTTAMMRRLVRPGDVILDVGANIGYFTSLFAKLTGPKGKVFAFEPEPRNFFYLSKNIQQNSYDHVTLFNGAVSSSPGKLKLFVCGYDSGHHTINQQGGIEAYRHGREGDTREIEIDAVKLDEWLVGKANRVDVVKIDVEGAEVLVLESMRRILTENRDVRLIVEFFPMLLKEMGTPPARLVQILLDELGFQLFIVGHDYSMDKTADHFIRVQSPEHLMTFIKDPADHLNLFATRDGELP